LKYIATFLPVLLAACVSTTSGDPVTATVNGQPGIVINTIVMGGEYPPSAADKAEAEQESRAGTKFNRLPAQAAKTCPSGYRILQADPITAERYMIPAAKTFVARWRQRFVIQCSS
jgi:hypothetical protein